MWSSDRQVLRKVYVTAWRRFCNHMPLSGVEPLIVQTLVAHPEYRPLYAQESIDDDPPAYGQTPPFLHLSLHVALLEQLASERPPGIGAHFARLTAALGDSHKAQHLMIDCLEETLFEAQRRGAAPDEKAYLACLERLPARTGP